MKIRVLLYFSVILAIFIGSLFSNPRLVTAAPAPLFKAILKDIRNQLPRDMVIRLPSAVPEIGIEGVKTYAIVRGYHEYQGGMFVVDFASRNNCSVTGCTVGNIVVSRGNPLNEEDGLSESRRQATPINLKAGIQGFYFYARSGSAGYRHHVFWKQNGLFFEVESRELSKQQVINMAISMAKEVPIKSAR